MAKVNIPTFKLNNGQQIPAVGYGTWLGGSDPPGGTEKAKDKKKDPEAFQLEFNGGPSIPYMKEALAYAIDIGYRHVDTAHVYRVEPEVGEVVNQKIKEKVIKRDDIFVTTKVWQHFHREGDVEVGLRGSLRRLKLDYVDMALMHWPFSVSQDGEDEKIDYLETWRGLEACVAKGLTRGIGVSNFTLEQMDRLLKNCKVPPAINQIEVNLNLGQTELVEFCQAHQVLVVAYTPLGTMIPSRSALNSPPPKLDDPTMVGMAQKYGKTVSQVVFRYLYQRGLAMIPKTITKSRVLENASIFDFHLDADDVATLKQFDVGYRTLVPVFFQDLQNYPFEKVPGKVPIPLSLLRWKNGYNGDIE